jgi:hypothetical protein
MASQTYTGSCQCGAVRFSTEADLDQVFTCNCSRCRRMGFTLAFTSPDAFRLEADGERIQFRFASHHIEHSFCATCGVEAFAPGTGPDGTRMVALNVNCLDGVDPRALNAHAYDGASA